MPESLESGVLVTGPMAGRVLGTGKPGPAKGNAFSSGRLQSVKVHLAVKPGIGIDQLGPAPPIVKATDVEYLKYTTKRTHIFQ